MPFVRTADTVTHEFHGARFTPLANPTLGSTDLCAWRVHVPAGTTGVPHSLNHEEVVIVLDGEVQFRLDDDKATLGRGEAIVVPAGHTLCVDTHAESATILATTRVGVQATTADGSRITPPWSL
jgi:quercetin dioxygenase-like cupin family protein